MITASVARYFLKNGNMYTDRPDLAEFHHFGKSLQVLGKFLIVYFLFGKMLTLLWQICDIIGLIFIVGNLEQWVFAQQNIFGQEGLKFWQVLNKL